MTTTKVGMSGQKPSVAMQPIDPNQPRVDKTLTEQQKYEKMWTVEDYRKVSPGEMAGNTFISVAQPEKGSEVIDFGTGTGRGAFYLWAIGGMNVTAIDFADNCLDADVSNTAERMPDRFRFQHHDLTQPFDKMTEYGYCTDVMEHIPTEDVDTVLYNIMKSARKVFFRISTTPDVMGPRYLKQHLHLTVQDYAWWTNKFQQHGAIILHSEDLGGAVDFYVTCWHDELPTDVLINTSTDKVLENIKSNAAFTGKSVMPHQLQPDMEVAMLCGGPSLNDYESEILELHDQNIPIITMNGSYNWAQDRGINNVNQCVIDARPFNKRFVEPVRDDCNYFIASQCDPSLFEVLPPERTHIWHVTTSPEAIEAIGDSYKDWALCGGGSTVALRAIILMRLLGFRKLTLYGFDSCVRDDNHHAYTQDENNSKLDLVPVMVGDRTFHCQPWMAYQAVEFGKMMKTLGNEIELTVKGDGLIAYMLETGADAPTLGE